MTSSEGAASYGNGLVLMGASTRSPGTGDGRGGGALASLEYKESRAIDIPGVAQTVAHQWNGSHEVRRCRSKRKLLPRDDTTCTTQLE